MTHPIISGAFCSYRNWLSYLFIKNEYVTVNFNKGGGKMEKLEEGPILISDWLPTLVNTPFEKGLHGAFETSYNEAFIFSENMCCRIDFDPEHLNKPKILEGPLPILSIFPYLEDTVFAHGIDAAINGYDGNVFLFKGDMHAHINIISKTRLAYMPIINAFPSWLGTVFVSGIDAAFATPLMKESYIFKGNLFARIRFNERIGGEDHLNGPIKYILDDWTCLRDILESEN